MSGQIVTELRGECGSAGKNVRKGEQLSSDKLRTLRKSTTACLVHAFKQVEHKLLTTPTITELSVHLA